MDTKSPLQSKTIQANVIIGALISVASQFGLFNWLSSKGINLDAATSTTILMALMNVALRFITNSPISLKKN